ncbi:DUF2231 domain-containing protein [Spongiactinospora sp. TRM90649]|uniref:DUF2231 domain-containing protein n=1 Tax=Spongiactinospora sp. TRM90649 TaxID=3031114 RepID=UPI0023F8167B|nr:DUF2231 domain-containing protein [Spongiactinospora sp. TRM90649]MDF5751986.1 hypothetical protein [Spongiactinospora sp. TRM90649]
MFEQILGLPAHPLIVHGAVVLAPLAVLASIAYALLPGWRTRLGWAVAGLSVAAPAAVFAARQSGIALKAQLFPDGPPAQMAGPIGDHEGFAGPLLWTTVGLGVAGLLMVFAGPRLGKTLSAVLSGVTVLLALAVGFYVIRAGHTGAIAVWGTR